MVVLKQYVIEDVKFEGKAYYKKNKKVVNSKTYGMLCLPHWLIGQRFDVILIPVEEKK